jgi:manganese-dependent inorganic pyrophosphatase
VYRFKGSLLALASQLSMCIPVVNAMATEFPVLTPDQSLKEIHGQVSHTNYSLPVVGEGGRLIGLISRSDLLDAARPRVILVDHFETHQAAPGIEDCEVVEIVDHHRVGSLETHSPIRVDCRPVGSTATIIACKFEEAGLAPSKAEARLLLGAMVSDTLLLTSPTTTDTDRLWARQLAKRAGVDLRQFGRDVLVRNDETLTKRPEDLIGKDLKEFGAGALRFGVAQVETVNRTRLEPGRLAEFAAAIGLRRAREGWAFLAVMITDVLRGDSLVFIDDPDRWRLHSRGRKRAGADRAPERGWHAGHDFRRR